MRTVFRMLGSLGQPFHTLTRLPPRNRFVQSGIGIMWSDYDWEKPSMDQYQCRGKLLKNFQDHWSIRISSPLRYGPMIGPYEFPPKLVWTNGAQSSLKVSVLTGIGP